MATTALAGQKSPFTQFTTAPHPMDPVPAFIPISPLPGAGGTPATGTVGYPI